MTGGIDVMLSQMNVGTNGLLLALSAAALIIGVAGIWSLWKVRRLLAIVPALQDRLDALTHSMSLLTDTTEACFKAVAMQVQFGQSAEPRPAIRKRRRPDAAAPVTSTVPQERQPRFAGAAGRTPSAAEIAAREDLSESEVALRMHINRSGHAAYGGGARYVAEGDATWRAATTRR